MNFLLKCIKEFRSKLRHYRRGYGLDNLVALLTRLRTEPFDFEDFLTL